MTDFRTVNIRKYADQDESAVIDILTGRMFILAKRRLFYNNLCRLWFLLTTVLCAAIPIYYNASFLGILSITAIPAILLRAAVELLWQKTKIFSEVSEGKFTKFWTHCDVNEERHAYVAEIKGKVVGVCCVKLFLQSHSASMHRTAVREEYTHRGIGRKLFAQVCDLCRERNCREMNMHTFDFLHEAANALVEIAQGKETVHRYLLFSEMQTKIKL